MKTTSNWTTQRTYTRHRTATGAASGPAEVAAIEVEHRRPKREPKTAADVIVPLAQSVITAGVLGILAGVLAWLADADVLRWSLAVGAVTLACAWFWRLGVVSALLAEVEKVTQHDLNGDGRIGKPEPDAGHLAVANPDAARQVASRVAKTAEAERQLAALLSFTRQCYAVGTSEAAQSVKPSERGDYLIRRDLLLRLGIGQWKNPNRPRAGWELAVDEATAIELLQRHVLQVGRDST